MLYGLSVMGLLDDFREFLFGVKENTIWLRIIRNDVQTKGKNPNMRDNGI